MKRNKTIGIKEAIDLYLKEMGIENRMREARVVNAWPTVVGPTMARYTSKVVFYNGVLFVTLSSSVARHELGMMRGLLVAKLNELAGAPVLTDIVLR